LLVLAPLSGGAFLSRKFMAKKKKYTLEQYVESVINFTLERKPAAGITSQDLEDDSSLWFHQMVSQGKLSWEDLSRDCRDEKKVYAALGKRWDSGKDHFDQL